MKALEILKDNYLSGQSDDMALYFQRHIQIAIKELEELKNRDCSTCSKNSYLDCPCWTYSDGKITDIKYCSEWTKKG